MSVEGEEEALLSEPSPSPLGRFPSASRITPFTVLLVLTGAIGGFLFGYDTGVVSGALFYLRDDPILAGLPAGSEDLVKGAIVAGTTVGAALGAGLGSVASDRLGRRQSILYADAFFTVGSVLLAFSTSAFQLIAGRVIVGLGVGVASMIVPVYIAEVSPTKDLRAALVTVNVLMITAGQFFSYLVNYFLSFAGGECWRWMLGVAALPAILQFGGMLFLPETPRWLALKGNLGEASKVLSKLSASPEDAAEFMREIQAPSVATSTAGVRVFSAFESKLFRYQVYVGVTLQVLQQLSGIYTVMYFTPVILSSAGIEGRQVLLMSMLPALTNAAMTLVGIWAIERMGRRKLLLSSLVGVALSLGLIGALFSFEAPYGWIVASLMLYLVCFAPGLSPVPWAVNSEIYPTASRGLGSGCSAVANWLSNSLISVLFPSLQHRLPAGGVFWLCGAVSVAGTWWAYLVLPETKGLSETEIQARFAERLTRSGAAGAKPETHSV